MTYKTFKETLAKYINLDEIIYDAALVLFALFFRMLFIPVGKTIVDILNPAAALALTLTIDFTAALLLGEIYRRYRPFMDKYKWLKRVIMPVIFLTMLFLYIGIPAAMHELGFLPPEWNVVPFIAGLFLIASGFVFGMEKDRKMGSRIGIILFLLPGLFGAIYLMLHIGVDLGNWLAGIGVFLGGLLLFAILILLLTKLSDKIFGGDDGKLSLPGTIIFKMILPVVTALALGFWQEIVIVNQAMAGKTGELFGNIIVTLIVYGIIPVRILMAAAPPYRLLNTLIGLASLAVYFFTLESYIEGLIRLYVK